MVAMRQVSVRDRHTLCVTFLLASVAMVRRSQDWMDSLSDAAEMAERAMIRPPSPQVAVAYGASFVAFTFDRVTEDVPAEVVQQALGGAVEIHSGGMPLSFASYAGTRDAAMAIGAATEQRPPSNGAEVAMPLVQHGDASSPSGVMLPSRHEAEGFMRTAKKQRRKEKLQCQWYCGYCRHYTPKTEARCVNCQTAKADVAGHDQAALLRLQSRKSRKKGRQQNSVGAGSAIDR